MFHQCLAELRNEAILIRRDIRRWCDSVIVTVPPPPSEHNPHEWPVEFDSDEEAEQAALFYVQSITYSRSVLDELISHQKRRGIDKDKPV